MFFLVFFLVFFPSEPNPLSRIKNDDEPLINFKSGKLLTADDFIVYTIY
jgi:hypothetical protein